MGKLRKMLLSATDERIVELMNIIDTQSNKTVSLWCIKYAQRNIIPIYEKYSDSIEPANLLDDALMYLEGEYSLKEVKQTIKDLNASIKGITNPIEEAALRTITTVASSVYSPQGSLSLAFYGTAAIAYEKMGLEEEREIYNSIAIEEAEKMVAALKDIAVENEENKVKIKWFC